jgi:NitT/TauT family transport system ATP-binding protein
MPHLLYIQDLYKRYNGKAVLDNVDLDVSSGELVTVVGPSGCGKSTLLRLILGQERPTSGEIQIDGQEVGFPTPQRGIVYQKYSLFPHLNVLENVTIGLSMSMRFYKRAYCKYEIEDKALRYLRSVKLFEHCEKYPHELSGGQQQRVAIAQALVMEPRILLMDEPFGALDPGTREHLQVILLEQWKKAKMTIFFVTHDLEEAVFLGTRIIVLSPFYCDGRGDCGNNHGSKIVADYQLEKKAVSTAVKERAEFGELIQQIRREGFDPKYLNHVTKFNLRHPDSFQTLTEEERRS